MSEPTTHADDVRDLETLERLIDELVAARTEAAVSADEAREACASLEAVATPLQSVAEGMQRAAEEARRATETGARVSEMAAATLGEQIRQAQVVAAWLDEAKRGLDEQMLHVRRLADVLTDTASEWSGFGERLSARTSEAGKILDVAEDRLQAAGEQASSLGSVVSEQTAQIVERLSRLASAVEGLEGVVSSARERVHGVGEAVGRIDQEVVSAVSEAGERFFSASREEWSALRETGVSLQGTAWMLEGQASRVAALLDRQEAQSAQSAAAGNALVLNVTRVTEEIVAFESQVQEISTRIDRMKSTTDAWAGRRTRLEHVYWGAVGGGAGIAVMALVEKAAPGGAGWILFQAVVVLVGLLAWRFGRGRNRQTER